MVNADLKRSLPHTHQSRNQANASPTSRADTSAASMFATFSTSESHEFLINT
ncbi:hypothetical protein [Streptomyces sp. NPDC058869]|uniref:hypothetical protein n=1 Tax=Streptomyces sp. NPDC058869 TaxID=3346659 RepID=UPI0036C6D33B